MKAIVNTFFAVFWMCFVIDAHLVAQPKNLRFEHLTELQGLSHGIVTSFCQDREGFIWIGTRDGLNKYDGYNFTVFRHNPNNPEHTLHSSDIHDIHEDQKGRLWVSTNGGGFHQVDKHTGKVTYYEIKTPNRTVWDHLGTIYEDQKGMLWMGTIEGIARFDPAIQQFTLYFPPDEVIGFRSVVEDAAHRLWTNSENGVYQLDQHTGKFTPMALDSSLARQPDCWSLILDKEGILWVGVGGEGLFQMNTHRSPLRFTRYDPEGLISKNKIVAFENLYEDGEGYVWVCTSEGLFRINKRTDQIQTFRTDQSDPWSLRSNLIVTTYQDRTGNLWVGGVGGINKVTAHAKKFHTHQIVPLSPPNFTSENNICALVEDHTGKILIGSGGDSYNASKHEGFYQFDPKTGKHKDLPVRPLDPDSPVGSQIWSLHEDKKNRLWAGTRKGLHLLDSTTSKFIRYSSEIPVEQIDEDPSGKLWIGKGGDGISPSPYDIAYFDPEKEQFKYYEYDLNDENSLTSLNVHDIMASRTGNIWIASSEGLACLNQQTGIFTPYLPNPDEGHLNYTHMHTIYEDTDGIIWVGTDQGGLIRFDPTTHIFTNFTMREGLPSNSVKSIISDESSNLWLGTKKGISQFNPTTKKFRNYDISDGLPSNNFRTGRVDKINGRLIFGSSNGFVFFYPDSIQDNATKPPVYITGFNVMEKSREVPTDKITLSYDENFLSFDFVALNYDTPEKNQYAYQLEGVDKDWVYSGNRRFASYTNLDPGKYVFKVKGSNNDGIWNEQGASLQVTLLPPWWQTGWAYTLYAFLALGALLSIRHYEMKRLKLRQRATYLSEMDSLKTRFFANISHEFRTPLTLILGPVKNLIDEHKAPKDQTRLNGIKRNAQRLLHLVNQLLDLSKLEASKLKLEAVKSDIISFLKARVHAFSSLADHKNIHFTVELPEEKIGIYFDRDKLEKIINNLLSNAFKFTGEGGSVTLKGQAVSQGNKDWFQIQVVDSGKGIPSTDINKIFDRFYQVDSTQTREQEGTGIGLALTKELVELHYGEINVESKKGKGTTFILLLPLGKAHLKEEEIIQELPLPAEETGEEEFRVHPSEILAHLSDNNLEKEATEQKTEKPMVLIVEDHQEVRRLIHESIGPQYQIKEAKNGRIGVAMAKELLPDLIISDVMMPEMDGYQLCDKIKTDELTSHIPVILLTAKADRQNKLTGLEIGADDYLSKPFDTEELQLIIRNHIEERRKMRERFSRDITLEPRSISITSLDERFLTKVLDIIEVHMDDENFSVDAFSREAGYSQPQLYRKIKALTDQTPSQFLRTVRLKRAAALLQQKNDTISQIAYRVGFNNLSYFNKCFKEQFGMTPGQYTTADQEAK